ncbi:MAG: hypothetical protein M1288_03630 [Actinobacteria bacterium]|jgi:hypothetical protein|nr:hypothetical protein [Actinomycetota bacterium]
MMKRIRWFITGTGFGVSMTLWVRKKIRNKIQEVTPLAVSKMALDSASAVKDRLSEAILEARSEMASAEISLRQEMGLPPKRKVRS